jgi:component of DNA polymerase V
MGEYPKKHGGRREGAGRKSKSGEATAVKRIPVSLIPTVDAMIASTPLPLGSFMPINRTSAKVPLAVEKIPAGFPSPAEPYAADYLDFNEYLITNPSATFAARSGGYSMLDAGIGKDDIMIIDRSKTPKHGDIVMADLGNEFTIKRLYKVPGRKPELHSENASDEYPDFVPTDGDTWSVVGVVTFVIKDVRQGG